LQLKKEPIMLIKAIQLFLLIVIFSGCNSNTKNRLESNSTKSKIINIANSYVAVKYPNSLNKLGKPIVKKNNNIWQITYTLPNNMLGGSPVIYIDENNYSIIRSYHGQ